jgi:hypothetical protein
MILSSYSSYISPSQKYLLRFRNMKFKNFSNKITLFSEIVKIILGLFQEIRNRYDLTDITAQFAGNFCRSSSHKLIGQLRDFIHGQGRIVDSDVVDQASEESSCFEIPAGTDVQTAI